MRAGQAGVDAVRSTSHLEQIMTSDVKSLMALNANSSKRASQTVKRTTIALIGHRVEHSSNRASLTDYRKQRIVSKTSSNSR